MKTERLILSPMKKGDLAWLHQLWTLPEVRRFLWDDVAIPKAQTLEILQESERAHEEQRFGLFAVADRAQNQKPFGFVGFWPFFEPPQIQLIFGLHPDAWGNGYIQEASLAMIDYGRNQLGMETIIAATDPPNTASIRTLERLGMRRKGEEIMDGKATLFFTM